MRLAAKRPSYNRIHDLRVASRRLMAALLLLDIVDPQGKKKRKQLRQRIEKLRKQLNELRDLQVQDQLANREVHPFLQIFLKDLEKKQHHEKNEIRHFLAQQDDLQSKNLIRSPHSRKKILRELQHQLRSEARNLEQARKSLSRSKKVQLKPWHEMRLAAKRLRYGNEFLQNLRGEKVTISPELIQFEDYFGNLRDLHLLIQTVERYILKNPEQKIMQKWQKRLRESELRMIQHAPQILRTVTWDSFASKT